MSTCRIRRFWLKSNFVIPEWFYRESSFYKNNPLWIPVFTGMTTFFALLFVLGIAIGSAGATGVETEAPVSSFTVEGVSGKADSTELFVGRRVALVVVGARCPGLEPFLAWRKQLSLEKIDQALIFCIGGHQPKNLDASIFVTPNKAMQALGITGTPMILGIEENRVKWRIAGRIPQWQVFAESWLNTEVK